MCVKYSLLSPSFHCSSSQRSTQLLCQQPLVPFITTQTQINQYIFYMLVTHKRTLFISIYNSEDLYRVLLTTKAILPVTQNSTSLCNIIERIYMDFHKPIMLKMTMCIVTSCYAILRVGHMDNNVLR